MRMRPAASAGRERRAWRPFAAALGLAALATAAAAAPVDGLHVPSPQWRDQVVYFVVTDRFDDGDPANNDQGTGEYDPADGAKFSGGDLAGLARRLGYIQGLGATAVWITPPVANQWWNPRVRYGGYHGYWASDFTRVDPHLGDLDDYRALSRALHGRGMHLVQDVVLNHVGDWFSYPRGWKSGDPAGGFVLTPDGQGRTAPARAPFSRNDARDPAQRAEGIYHWTPDITDYDDPRQLSDWQLAGLDDLDTANPEVRRALRAAYGGWIRDVGVDAFRLDTAFYVPHADLRDFMQSDDPRAPGMVRAAAATGRDDFLVFGEGFGIDRGCEDVQERRIEGYVRDAEGPVLPAMINFPLYGALSEVFARGAPTARLGCRIRLAMARHAHPELMPSFVDNHDVDRFLAGGSEAALKQALLAIMTLPGIPVVYYGTEQGFTGQRAAMFAGGFGSGGRDHFDVQAPLYRYLQGAIALRREHPLFSRGTPTVLREDAAGAGAFAYRMDGEGSAALVVFNTADHDVLLDNLDTGLAPGSTLRGMFGTGGTPADAVVGRGGKLSLRLPPRSGDVWRMRAPPAAASRPEDVAAPPRPSLSLSPLPAAPFAGDFEVSGQAEGLASFRLVVDGDLASAQVVRPGADGRWRASVDTSAMLDPGVEHALVAWSGAPEAVSERLGFRVARPWTLLADVADPAGDDHGPQGRYRYPADASWGDNRQLDIEHVRAYGAGGALKVELRMHAVTAQWSPPNGFDHVAFTVFLQLPERSSGTDAMPLQNATLPGGMHWQYRLRANGWSNALFAAEGASASAEGRVLSPGAGILVDQGARTIGFVIPARALGNPATLSGARLYVSTWDYDAAPRPLRPEGGTHAFGGGDGSRDPLVMDDTGVIVLR